MELTMRRLEHLDVGQPSIGRPRPRFPPLHIPLLLLAPVEARRSVPLKLVNHCLDPHARTHRIPVACVQQHRDLLQQARQQLDRGRRVGRPHLRAHLVRAVLPLVQSSTRLGVQRLDDVFSPEVSGHLSEIRRPLGAAGLPLGGVVHVHALVTVES